MKSDLTLIIHKWERSGQGEGGRMDDVDDDEESFGNVHEESFGNVPEVLEDTSKAPEKVIIEWGRSEGQRGAFDSQDSFLGTNPSYLLYFWDALDNNDLFNMTMNCTMPLVRPCVK